MDMRDEVARIAMPTLVIYGDQDPVTPPSDAQFLLDHNANSTSLSLSAAHLSNIEAADAFTTGLLHFLDKTEPTP